MHLVVRDASETPGRKTFYGLSHSITWKLRRMSDKHTGGNDSRGRRKLTKDAITALPHEIVRTFARLPRVFKRLDIDRLMGDKISRSMKWRYLNKMEHLGLIKHSTKKYYQKLHNTVSEWMEKDVLPKIRRAENRSELDSESA